MRWFAKKPRKNPADSESRIIGNVVMVLTDQFGNVKTTKKRNIVTDAGDEYYAERCSLRTSGAPITPVPTNFTDTNGDFDGVISLYQSDSGPVVKGNDFSDLGTLIVNSEQAMDSGFPENDNQDAANTGKALDAVTYKVTYTTANANGSIDDVVIADPSASGTDPLLMHADGLAVTKTSNDTLVVYVNHLFAGS